jgi:NADPH:quinone reductase-like Zn-dependent oxidoreductase
LVLVGGEASTGKLLQGFDRQLRALVVSPVIRHRLIPLVATESAEDLAVLTEFIEAGHLKPVVSHTFPLSEVPAALRQIHHGHSQGKSVISLE